MEKTNSISVTIPNPTAKQIAALTAILAGTSSPMADLAAGSKKGSSKKLAKTVSDDEDEDYGTDGELDDEDLECADDEDEEEEKPAKRKAKASIDEDEEETETDEAFEEVRAAINKLGNKNAAAMKTILASFNIKTAKEVEQHPKKYAAILLKVKKKLKLLAAK